MLPLETFPHHTSNGNFCSRFECVVITPYVSLKLRLEQTGRVQRTTHLGLIGHPFKVILAFEQPFVALRLIGLNIYDLHRFLTRQGTIKKVIKVSRVAAEFRDAPSLNGDV